MRKIISVLIAVLMAFSSCAVSFSAFSSDGEQLSEPIKIDNPFYSGREVYFGSIDSASTASKVKTYKNVKYYSLGKELYTAIKNKCQTRTDTIKLNYLATSRLSSFISYQVLMDDLWTNVTEDEIATSTTDGDYLRWQVGYFLVSSVVQQQFKDGYYYYTIKVEPLYYSTKEQEKLVDKVINNFVNSFDTNKYSDYETIRKIHDFINGRTTYDYEATSSTLYSYSAYGALVRGESVCQGYANAFYRICRELGYKARIVTSDPQEGCHAWNIVDLDGKYYSVDCTWDDEVTDNPSDFPGLNSYSFLLLSDENSREDDKHNEHVLEPLYYDTSYFNTNYRSKFDTFDYKRFKNNLISKATISLSSRSYTYDGAVKKPAVTVKMPDGTVLENGTDYTVSYSTNPNTGSRFLSVKGAGAYSGALSRRFINIKPQKCAKPAIKKLYNDSVSLKWTASKGEVSGYAIEIYNNKKWSVAAYTNTPTATISSLSPATVYKFRVRAYKSVNKRAVYGAYSNEKVLATRPNRVGSLALKTSSKKINAKWKKAKGTGYVIQYSTNKNMKNAKTITVTGAKNVSKTVKNLKSGTKYYFRVRAFKCFKISGVKKTVYGSWSAKKVIKCK